VEIEPMPEQTLRSITFPTLDAAQIHEFDSGEVAIVDHSGDAPKPVAIHGKGQLDPFLSAPRRSATRLNRAPRASAMAGR
jgi:hypothetical protein